MRLSAFLLLIIQRVATEVDDACSSVPMKEWAGEEAKHKATLVNPVPMVMVQHTVYRPCHTEDECVEVIKGIRQYHMTRNGFDDIGESFLVGGDGKVYEGAGWKYVGTHAKGYNTRSIDLSFLGDFRKNLPTPAALQAAKDFLACAEQNGLLTADYGLVGHQQVAQTKSPGAMLQQEIEGWPHWVAEVN